MARSSAVAPPPPIGAPPQPPRVPALPASPLGDAPPPPSATGVAKGAAGLVPARTTRKLTRAQLAPLARRTRPQPRQPRPAGPGPIQRAANTAATVQRARAATAQLGAARAQRTAALAATPAVPFPAAAPGPAPARTPRRGAFGRRAASPGPAPAPAPTTAAPDWYPPEPPADAQPEVSSRPLMVNTRDQPLLFGRRGEIPEAKPKGPREPSGGYGAPPGQRIMDLASPRETRRRPFSRRRRAPAPATSPVPQEPPQAGPPTPRVAPAPERPFTASAWLAELGAATRQRMDRIAGRIGREERARQQAEIRRLRAELEGIRERNERDRDAAREVGQGMTREQQAAFLEELRSERQEPPTP